jgi:Escherichia/Staphylococcus phage prohead protease
MNKDFKSCGLEIKGVDETKGIVEFYFSSFGNKDSDGDIMEKGAFKKSISENASRIKHFKNHNPHLAVGRILELHEDEKGAFAVSQMSKSTLGKDTLIEYQEGIITEHSHGFQTIRESHSKERDANIISEVKLWEVSSLTAWGANSETPTTGIKNIKDINKLFKSLENILTKSKISEERGLELQKSYDQLGILIKSLQAPSDDDTQEAERLKREEEQRKFYLNI